MSIAASAARSTASAINLDIKHEASGQGGQLETMAYTNLGDPSWACYRALTGA